MLRERRRPPERLTHDGCRYEDLPDAEIADVLGCRTPTVRTAIHRGLRALRKEIDR